MAAAVGPVGLDRTVVLRRRSARIVAGRPEGGYTNMSEIICRECGDDPGRDYREVSPRRQRVRGPYPIAAGIAAYRQHLGGTRTGRRFSSQAAQFTVATLTDRLASRG